MLIFITFILIGLTVVSASDAADIDINNTDISTNENSEIGNSNIQSNIIEKDSVSSNDINKIETNFEKTSNQSIENISDTHKEITKSNDTTQKTDTSKISSTIIIDEVLFAGKDNSANISAIVKDQYGRTINSGKVAFKVSGITVDTVNIVNSHASIIYPATKLNNKFYVFNVVYGGSKSIEPARVNTTLKVLPNLSTYTFSQIGDAANRTKVFIEKYRQVPNYITVNGDKIDPEDFLYMLARTTLDKSSVSNGKFGYSTSSDKTNCVGTKLYQDEYMELSEKIVSYYAKYDTNPSSVTINNYTLSFNDTFYFYSRLIAYTYINSNKPNYGVVLNLTRDETAEDYNDNSNSTRKQFVNIELTSYKVYPNSTVTLTAYFKYGDSRNVDNLACVFKANALTIGNTMINDGVAKLTFVVPNWGVKDYTLEVKVGETKNSYQSSAQATLTVLNTNNQSSANVDTNDTASQQTPTSYKTKIILDEIYFAKSNSTGSIKAKIVDSQGNLVNGGKFVFKINDKTFDTVTVENGIATLTYDTSSLSTSKTYDVDVIYGGSGKYNSSSNSSYLRVTPTLYKVTYSQVLKAANNTKNFIESNNRLPNYVTIGDYQVSLVDYFYLIGQTVTSNTSYASPQFSNYTPSATTNCYNKNLSKEQYIKLADYYINSLITTAKLPTTLKNDVGTLSFADAVYLMTRAVAFIYNNDVLPAYSMILPTTVNSVNLDSLISGNSVSSSLSEYLAITKNCEVNSSYIKNAVKEAITGVSGTLNQAKAIFNYVNDHTSYLYYSNTRYGAIKTLSLGYGNCVDTSHVLVAMFRTANIPARYVHGKNCVFRSGLQVGHVWAEVYVGGTWYKCDASSNYNSFNNIVNWYANTGAEVRYIELPF